MNRRRPRRVSLVGMSPGLAQSGGEAEAWRFPSYGMRRVEAALKGDPRFAGLEVSAHELPMLEAGELADLLLDDRSDLYAFSAYIWSFPTFLETARLLRRRDPDCGLLFGGPSAEPAMCALPSHADALEVLDALVLGEGEVALREILAAGSLDPGALATIRGLALPDPRGWRRTPPRPLDERLDELPSPAALGLLRRNDIAYLETFRGCPLSCSFCEWGTMGAGSFFSREYLTRELQALAALEPVTTYLVDAGLNLNARAFRNLAAAEAEVGFFAARSAIVQLYPSLLGDEHLRFLEGAGSLWLSVGLQSFDEEVLGTVDRKAGRERFDRVVSDLSQLPNVRSLTVELILGLPADRPERFAASLARARGLGCGVRVYRCLVLPNGLMTRAPAEQQVRFDERTLMLTSSVGWSPEALAHEHRQLDALAAATPGGAAGEYWWYLPPVRG